MTKYQQLMRDLTNGQKSVASKIRRYKFLDAFLKVVVILCSILSFGMVLAIGTEASVYPMILLILALPFALNHKRVLEIKDSQSLSAQLLGIQDKLAVTGESALPQAIDDYLKISGKIPS